MTQDTLHQVLKDHFNSLNRIVFKSLEEAVSVHHRNLQSYAEGVVAYRKEEAEAGNEEEAIKKKLAFHRSSQQICNSVFTEITGETPLTSLLSVIKQEQEALLEKIPEKMPLPYPPGYFSWKRKGSFSGKMGRSIQWFLLTPLQTLRSMFNPLRRLFRKPVPEPVMPQHRVHLSDLYEEFLLTQYLQRLTRLVQELRGVVSSALSEVMKDEFNEPAEPEWKDKFETLLGGFFREHRDEFDRLMNISGSPLTFTDLKNRTKVGSLHKAFSGVESVVRSWRVTYFAFYEDWRFRECLLSYIQEIRLLQLEVSSIFTSRIRTTLHPELEKQKAFINTMLSGLPDPDNTSIEELRSYLVKELYKLNKEQKQQSEERNIAYEAAETIPGILQKLESEIEEKLEDFPDKVGVVYAPDYQKGIRQSEIRYFSPSEFLEFNSLAGFLQVNKQLKAAMGKLLEKIVREFREFDQIVDFYLDSAITLTQKPGIGEDEVIITFREGLKRLAGISDRSKALLDDLEQKNWPELYANTEAYIDSVIKLDDNDNILNIYSRLIKSKAMASSAQNKQRLASGFRKSLDWLSGFATRHFSWLKTSYQDIRKRLRLTTSTAIITSEISNYLAGIRNRINELPVIYQHLFEPEPVKEQNLFLSREKETEKLNHALRDWEKGNFAATMVTGETGSGSSSLLLHYARTLKSPYPIHRFQVDRFYFNEQDYYALVGEIFNQPEIRDEGSLAAYISTMTEKIVIIDGLERLFLRKVNGFECLRRFLSLVVNTNELIFWICSVSKIAYHYLNRTVALSEHFDYILDIDNLTGKDIREIIMKRNRLSGYEVMFQNTTETSKEASEADQEEMETLFFTDLERFAGSNIALSLIYWLQSVQGIEDEGIKVGQLSVPDFEFLDNLPARKAYVLLLVILHGKISDNYHAQACSCPMAESSGLLSILREDAILVKKDEYFVLNGILYKHVVKLLKDRNLIH